MNAPPGLVYFPDSRPGITRRRCGRGFSYRAPDGTTIDDRAERRRIAALAVPPAYRKVWISPRRNGHLQATGYDARTRKQYRYHPDWTEFRADVKFRDLAAFGAALPRIRRRIARDLNAEAGEHDFAIAAVLAMIDKLSLRIGNADYTAENGTYGATTLTNRHLRLRDGELRLRFKAKGGALVDEVLRDRKLNRVLGKLHDLPGGTLASWIDDDGTPRSVTSQEINAWLSDLVEREGITAKTFRTWNGSVAALEAAAKSDEVTIRAMAEAASKRLANTPAIARKSYIHPRVIALAEDPTPLDRDVPQIAGLRRSEQRLLGLLEES